MKLKKKKKIHNSIAFSEIGCLLLVGERMNKNMLTYTQIATKNIPNKSQDYRPQSNI